MTDKHLKGEQVTGTGRNGGKAQKRRGGEMEKSRHTRGFKAETEREGGRREGWKETDGEKERERERERGGT